MPPKRSYSSDSEDSDSGSESDSGGKPLVKRRGKGSGDDDDDDEGYTTEDAEQDVQPGDLGDIGNPARPGWRAGRYTHLVQKNRLANSGRLVCKLCNKAILLDAKGKEDYVKQALGPTYSEKQQPHIDHCNPDWVIRKATVEKFLLSKGAAYTAQHGKAMYSWAVNAQRLEIVHRHCNLQKAKANAMTTCAHFLAKIKKTKPSSDPVGAARKPWLP